MKVLITGGTGFVGSHLVSALVEKGFVCRLLVRDREKANKLFTKKVELFEGDITKPSSLDGLAKGITHVLHLAALGHVSAISDKAYYEFIRVNVQGSLNLLEACKETTIYSFVHLSSTAAMGLLHKEGRVNEVDTPKPLTPYQRSKLESEKAVLRRGNELGIPVVVLRPCMIYGMGHKNSEFFKIAFLMRKGLFPKVGKGKNLTPLVHVDDVVHAIIAAMLRGRSGEVYLIASKSSLPMDELRRLVIKAWGNKAFYPYVPVWLMFSAATIIEFFARITNSVPIFTKHNIANTVWDREFSIDKACLDLGYIPEVEFSEGIHKAVNWYKEQTVK